MPVISVETLSPGIKLGVWRIAESAEMLLAAYPHLETVVAEYRNHERKIEKLAVYALLYAMTGTHRLIVAHNADGKPLLARQAISISDTKGFVAVVTARNRHTAVAVDIEYISNRVGKIVRRFVRADEHAPTTSSQLIHWSAKETVYKYYSPQHLQYSEMRLQPFTVKPEDCIKVQNLKQDSELCVHYRLTDEYVLTYAYAENASVKKDTEQ